MSQSQPKGLYYLFMTEMWERYSFHGMRALLILYMTEPSFKGGLEWDNRAALKLYSYYLAGAYITPILGGYLADRWLGARRAAFIGGSLMALGHLLMSFHTLECFYLAILLVCFGNGFFKPNITALLGRLYSQDDPRRNIGFSIFYVGINLGALLAGFLSGFLHRQFGFEAGFLAASAGMVLGLSILSRLPKNEIQLSLKTASQTSQQTDPQTWQQIARQPLNTIEKDRLRVIVLFSLAVAIFMFAFGQSGGLINLFVNRWADRSCLGYIIPPAFFLSLNPLFGILFAPLISLLWMRMGTKEPQTSQKIAIGLFFASAAFGLLWLITPYSIMQTPGSSHALWLIPFYALITVAEMCILPLLWSSISKLSPEGWLSSLMAVALFAMGVGGWSAGQFASLVDSIGPSLIFATITLTCSTIALLLLKLSPKVSKWGHGID